MPAVTSDDRSFISVSGEDAEALLQGIITTDLDLVAADEAWPGALLTPQGKILFEFLIGRTDSGFLLETAAADADGFIKRLTLYRLRASVTFEKQETSQVSLIWDETLPEGGLRDQRFARAGIALTRMRGHGGSDAISLYRGLRFANGISGGGEDGHLGDYFPHDLMMDRNGGLSFKKGCYIGQEVVSRMQHRSTARRRLVSMTADYALGDAGAPVLAGGKEIGTMIAAEGNKGLAVVRIDKAGAALAGGMPMMLGEQTVALTLPAWSGLDFPAEADEAAS
ncbi:MAG: folate-binding protein [Rhizobium sp.]|nr:folate-binding protein [Rhizobium sp.]